MNKERSTTPVAPPYPTGGYYTVYTLVWTVHCNRLVIWGTRMELETSNALEKKERHQYRFTTSNPILHYWWSSVRRQRYTSINFYVNYKIVLVNTALSRYVRGDNCWLFMLSTRFYWRIYFISLSSSTYQPIELFVLLDLLVLLGFA